MMVRILLWACCSSLFCAPSAFLHSGVVAPLPQLAASRWTRSGAYSAVGRVRSVAAVKNAAAPAATEAAAHGTVNFDRTTDLAVEETVTVFYKPPPGLFSADADICYCGGFNGWDGDETPVMMPALREADGRYRVSINIPNFAKVLDFVFTDGVRYDTGPGDAFYHLRVTHVRDVDDKGNVITYIQDADGKLVKTGMIETVDPMELERMIDEGMDKVMNDGLRNEVMVSVDEQASVQQMRAEASVMGERLGLGNMQVNEARDAFDRHDDKNGLLSFDAVKVVFAELGLDMLDSTTLSGLFDRHVFAKRPDATSVTLYEFMYMFAELDKADAGIDMV